MADDMKQRIPDNLRQDVADMVRGLWWSRVLLATEHDHLGLILRAVMCMPTESPPWFGPSAIIDDKGVVLSNYVGTDNKMRFATVVCHVDDLVNNLRELCNQLALSDVQANALFAQVKAWIKSDARPETEQPEDRIPLEYRRT